MIAYYQKREVPAFRAVYYNGHNADEVKEMAGASVAEFDGGLWLMKVDMETLIPPHSYVIERNVYGIMAPDHFQNAYELTKRTRYQNG
jgi:hypothetical protein